MILSKCGGEVWFFYNSDRRYLQNFWIFWKDWTIVIVKISWCNIMITYCLTTWCPRKKINIILLVWDKMNQLIENFLSSLWGFNQIMETHYVSFLFFKFPFGKLDIKMNKKSFKFRKIKEIMRSSLIAVSNKTYFVTYWKLL